MNVESRSLLAAMEGPADRPATRVRTALSSQNERLELRFPRALDLAAGVLAAMSAPLDGVKEHLNGTHRPSHFREFLRGERPIGFLGDLCRLATDPSREAGEAIDAALAVLASARRWQLVRVPGAALADPHQALAHVIETAGLFEADFAREVCAGVDPDEAETGKLAAEIVDAKAALAEAEAVVLARQAVPCARSLRGPVAAREARS